MFISDPNFSTRIPEPASKRFRIRIKECKYFWPQKFVIKLPAFSIPDPEVKKAPDPGSAILLNPRTDFGHFFKGNTQPDDHFPDDCKNILYCYFCVKCKEKRFKLPGTVLLARYCTVKAIYEISDTDPDGLDPAFLPIRFEF